MHLQAVDDIYNLSMKDRAAQIKARWKQEDIYKKRGQNAKVTADEPILTKISKHWATSGQQTNKTRLLIAKAFQANYSPPDISLEIRRYSFRGTRFDEKQKITPFTDDKGEEHIFNTKEDLWEYLVDLKIKLDNAKS